VRHLGSLQADRGQLEQAISLYEQSLDVSETLGNRYAAAMTTRSLAAALEQQGKEAEATTAYKKAIDLFGELGDKSSIQDIQETLHRLGGEHQ
jgi:tetratricopeptide (TPR) repeat protein